MCAVCHLAPGMTRTEVSRGLYPRAPELRRGSALTPAEEFWVGKRAGWNTHESILGKSIGAPLFSRGSRL
jgi:hypothetical protein